MRHDPYVMNAHSAKTCQCSSRTPPAISRMLTPAMVSEIWKSACVTCRAQPPFWIRFGALLNDAQNCGRSPTSVAGGDDAAGNWSASTGLCGPGSVTLAGFAALTAPCGGSSGLPNAAARASAERTDAAASPAAPAPNRLRLVTSTTAISTKHQVKGAPQYSRVGFKPPGAKPAQGLAEQGSQPSFLAFNAPHNAQ